MVIDSAYFAWSSILDGVVVLIVVLVVRTHPLAIVANLGSIWVQTRALLVASHRQQEQVMTNDNMTMDMCLSFSGAQWWMGKQYTTDLERGCGFGGRCCGIALLKNSVLDYCTRLLIFTILLEYILTGIQKLVCHHHLNWCKSR